MQPERTPNESRLSKPIGRARPSCDPATGSGGRKAAIVSIKLSSGMIWRGPEYPLLSPGVYMVRGSKVQGPEYVRNFHRWSIRIEFALTAEPGSVSMFLNLGGDKTGPQIKRQSRYFKAWVLANGEQPRRGQAMTADVFLEGQFFQVEVETCMLDSEGEIKPEAEWYSRITRIVSMAWP
jgi:hypothetical protein